jgi:dienelactone hydrolase
MRWGLCRLALMSAACACTGSGGGTSPDADRAAPAWETAETTFEDASIRIEKVSYRSQGLRIFGQVCRPKSPGRHRVLAMNHGGFAGLGTEWNGGGCKSAATSGWVVLASSYRGEDGSEGRIEICLGEVDDVLAMLAIGLAQPYADPSRVAMWGGSHGGCITTRAVQRGAPVHAAIDLFGPKDWAADFEMWKANLSSGAGGAQGAALYRLLIRQLEESTGGTPDSAAGQYAKRSPINFVSDLDRYPHAFMAQHGTLDGLVLVSDTCRLAAALPRAKSYHLDVAAAVVTTSPQGCESVGVTWLPGPRPTRGWPDARYVIVYSGLGHGFDDAPSSQAAFADYLSFLSAKIP